MKQWLIIIILHFFTCPQGLRHHRILLSFMQNSILYTGTLLCSYSILFNLKAILQIILLHTLDQKKGRHRLQLHDPPIIVELLSPSIDKLGDEGSQ